jgi:hypothetical protein
MLAMDPDPEDFVRHLAEQRARIVEALSEQPVRRQVEWKR